MRGTKTEVRRGVWRLRVVARYDAKTGNPRQMSRTIHASTKKQADEELAAFLLEVRNGRQRPVESTATLDSFLDGWLEHIAGDRQPTTIRGYREKLIPGPSIPWTSARILLEIFLLGLELGGLGSQPSALLVEGRGPAGQLLLAGAKLRLRRLQLLPLGRQAGACPRR